MFDSCRNSFVWTDKSERFLRCDPKAGNHICLPKTVFEKYKSSYDQADVILEQQLRSALEECGNMMSGDEIQNQFRKMTAHNDARGVDFEDFARIVATPSILEKWAETLPMSRILALCIHDHQSSDGELLAVDNLTCDSIEVVVDVFAQQLKRVLLEAVEKFKQASNSRKMTQDRLSTAESKISRFCDAVPVRGGDISDFHKALTERIGWPNLSFLESIRLEHSEGESFPKPGSGILITPKEEFEWVTSIPVHECREEGSRKHPDVDELMQKDFARIAELKREEVIAVILYTGPMYHAYNNELRTAHNVEKGRHQYPTTIFLIASAVTKLTRVQNIPHGTLLYRGLGGDVEFPKSFYQPDSKGCKGMTEFGFLSTTADKDLAIRYSGAGEFKPFPMIMEIAVGSVDRGANIAEFSQYPHQGEYLWAPGAFLEPLGSPTLEVREGSGVVYVVRVRTVCNIKTMTTDELLSSRKDMHLKAFDDLIREVKGGMTKLEDKIEDRLRRDVSRDCDSEGNHVGAPICTCASLVERIVQQCNEVRDAHGKVNAGDYVKGEIYRDLVCEMLKTTAMAQSKLHGWLEDASRRICFDFCLPLRICHGERLSYLFRTLPEHGQDRVDKAKALCMAMGLIANSVSGTKDCLVAAAADGRPVHEIKLLLAAGAKVNGRAKEGTPLLSAAQFGHAHIISELCKAKADVNMAIEKGQVPIWIAARNGHLKCVQALIEAHADVDSADHERSSAICVAAQRGHKEIIRLLKKKGADINAPDYEGSTPVLAAAYNGLLDCISCLIQLGADVKRANKKGSTPLMVAAQMANADCVELLIRHTGPVSGLLDPTQQDETGWSPFHFAAYGGSARCIRLLSAAGFDVTLRDHDGATPVLVAAEQGHACAISALVEARADVAATGGEGSSPLWVAAREGHRECIQALLLACADAGALDTAGRSPVWAAADRGHTACVQLLHDARADIGFGDREGVTPEQAAAAKGHDKCVELLKQLSADNLAAGGDHGSPSKRPEGV